MVSQAYGDHQGNGPIHRIEYTEPSILFAGMLASNLEDLSKYAQALLDRKLLSPPGFEVMWSYRPGLPLRKSANWAFGWASSPAL